MRLGDDLLKKSIKPLQVYAPNEIEIAECTTLVCEYVRLLTVIQNTRNNIPNSIIFIFQVSVGKTNMKLYLCDTELFTSSRQGS